MAATDMSKAGLEVGCKVRLPNPDSDYMAETRTDVGRDNLREMRAFGEVWEVTTIFGPEDIRRAGGVRIKCVPPSISRTVPRGDLTRDYDDAQKARHARFNTLLAIYPGDAGVPEDTDTIERYVVVQKGEHEYAFGWGDTFDEAAQYAGGEILDGWWPEGVFDLDTGSLIDLHISSPIITPSEDQGVSINPLNPEEMSELASRFAGITDAAAKALRGEIDSRHTTEEVTP